MIGSIRAMSVKPINSKPDVASPGLSEGPTGDQS